MLLSTDINEVVSSLRSDIHNYLQETNSILEINSLLSRAYLYQVSLAACVGYVAR